MVCSPATFAGGTFVLGGGPPGASGGGASMPGNGDPTGGVCTGGGRRVCARATQAAQDSATVSQMPECFIIAGAV